MVTHKLGDTYTIRGSPLYRGVVVNNALNVGVEYVSIRWVETLLSGTITYDNIQAYASNDSAFGEIGDLTKYFIKLSCGTKKIKQPKEPKHIKSWELSCKRQKKS